jgi:16S rRNA G527 N7-methylase RsmG
VKPEEQAVVERATGWAGLAVTDHQMSLLERYRRWLQTEAVPAGALGPNELSRLVSRHVADSLCFGVALPADSAEVVDIGSGAGLPGVPLAIVMPGTRFRLVERSGRRVDLLRRVVRILGVENVVVEQADYTDYRELRVVVTRATVSTDQVVDEIRPLLGLAGVAVIGGSWRERPVVPDLECLEIPPEILDQPVWILIMRQT